MKLKTTQSRHLLRNVMGGGKSLALALSLSLTLTLPAACSEEHEAPDDLSSPTRTAADSTAARGGTTTVTADTAWADTLDYDFSGRPATTITLPSGTPDEGDASEAV